MEPTKDIGHPALLSLVAQLRVDGTLDQAKASLGRLQTALPGHFTAEEGPEGLFEQILEAAPRNELAIRRLTAEHADMLATASSLALRLEALTADIEAFANRIKSHEFEEGQLQAKSLYEDIGGGD